MSNNFSLQNLFKAGLTREQFIAKYGEIKSANGNIDSSVFSDSMAGSIGEIFDTLNTDGNDTIDENELNTFMAYADDGDNNTTITENDLKVLYEKVSNKISSAYTSTDPKVMYENAMAKTNGDVTSSTYIADLESQIDVLNELIASRQTNSSNIIAQYQAKIDDLVMKSSKLSADFKKEYKTTSEDAAKLQKESDKNNSLIQKKQNEIQYVQNEADIINKELSGMDEDSDKDDILSGKDELAKLSDRQKTLGEDYEQLTSQQSGYSSALAKAKAKLAQLTVKAQNEDSALKIQIQTYKGKIEEEKASAQSDIAGYKSQLNVLQQARDYAVSQIQVTSDSTGAASGGASHKNDNLMTFDELNKQGLKYSSEKGQKLAGEVRKRAVGFTGHCSRYVSNALASSGLGHERAAAAHMMDTKLEGNSNFKEVKITSQEQLRNLPAGCIVVYEAGAARYSSKYGHIEVTLGDGTAASDGITKNMRYSDNMSVFIPVENA